MRSQCSRTCSYLNALVMMLDMMLTLLFDFSIVLLVEIFPIPHAGWSVASSRRFTTQARQG